MQNYYLFSLLYILSFSCCFASWGGQKERLSLEDKELQLSIVKLKDTTLIQRYSALRRVETMGACASEASPYIIELLNDHRLIQDEGKTVGQYAAELLSIVGKEYTDTLVELAENYDEPFLYRGNVILALGGMREPSLNKLYLKIAGNKREYFPNRLHAVRGIIAINHRESNLKLLSMLSNYDDTFAVAVSELIIQAKDLDIEPDYSQWRRKEFASRNEDLLEHLLKEYYLRGFDKIEIKNLLKTLSDSSLYHLVQGDAWIFDEDYEELLCKRFLDSRAKLRDKLQEVISNHGGKKSVNFLNSKIKEMEEGYSKFELEYLTEKIKENGFDRYFKRVHRVTIPQLYEQEKYDKEVSLTVRVGEAVILTVNRENKPKHKWAHYDAEPTITAVNNRLDPETNFLDIKCCSPVGEGRFDVYNRSKVNKFEFIHAGVDEIEVYYHTCIIATEPTVTVKVLILPNTFEELFELLKDPRPYNCYMQSEEATTRETVTS